MQKRMRKILSGILVILMLVSCVPISTGIVAVAADDETEYTENGFTYTVENGEATITGYTGSVANDFIIPSKLGGYDVKIIDAEAFSGFNMKSVTIPDSVEEILREAFRGCRNLSNVKMSGKIKHIGYDAFKNSLYYNTPENWTNGLLYLDNCLLATAYDNDAHAWIVSTKDVPDEIQVKDGTKVIADYAFEKCYKSWYDENDVYCETGIKKVVIPNSVISIGYMAFLGCTLLSEVIMPEKVEYFGEYVFSSTAIHEISVPEGVTEMVGVFDSCKNLKDVTLPSSLKVIGAFCFENCYSLNNISIPNGVEEIDSYAFNQCSSLSSIVIPDSVTVIGNNAFFNCSALCSIKISENLTSIGSNAFYGVPSNYENGALYLGKYLISVIDTLVEGNENASVESFSIKEGTTLIAGKALCNSDFSEIIIPDTVKYIDDQAFSGCENLKTIVIPDSVESISIIAFAGCTSLENVIIPDTVSDFDGYLAFSGCTNLKTVSLPKGMTELLYTFNNCTSLVTVEIPYGVEVVQGAFLGCTSLKKVNIPNTVTSLRFGDFSGCTSLESVTLPDSIETLGFEVFSGCTSLKEVTLSKNIKHTMGFNFEGCSSLEKVTIPNGAKIIGAGDFLDCTSLKEVTTPNTVESIEALAFGYYTIYDEDGQAVDYKKVENFTIKGYINTAAEDYADENGFTFIDLNGHVHNYEVIQDTKVTCTADGEKVYKCNSCGRTRSEKTKATGHTEVAVAETPATCSSNGKTAGTSCSVCNEVLSGQETIYSSGHIDMNSDGYCDECNADLNPSAHCSCNCHKGGFMGFIYKIQRIFWKLFRTNKTCSCGAYHY